MNKRIALIIVVIVAVILIVVYQILPSRSGVDQPIAFNHLLHTEEVGLDCSECHQYFMEHRSSGLPDGQICGQCHEEPMTESPEEKKLSAMLQDGEGVYFRKLFHLPDHVNYSHRMHVRVAGLKCENCHGGIAKTTSPPRQPLVKVSMKYCMGCHEKMGVTNDCIACHR